jgi:hypothetical protein
MVRLFLLAVNNSWLFKKKIKKCQDKTIKNNCHIPLVNSKTFFICLQAILIVYEEYTFIKHQNISKFEHSTMKISISKERSVIRVTCASVCLVIIDVPTKKKRMTNKKKWRQQQTQCPIFPANAQFRERHLFIFCIIVRSTIGTSFFVELST